MRIVTPVVGIPDWPWKKKLAKSKQGKAVECIVDDLIYELTRHAEILRAFDNHSDITKTAYYKYYADRDPEYRVYRFKKLYDIVKTKSIPGYPVITANGCRLDGSHRLSIWNHLGVEKAEVWVVSPRSILGKKEAKQIDEQVKQYRRAVYGFPE